MLITNLIARDVFFGDAQTQRLYPLGLRIPEGDSVTVPDELRQYVSIDLAITAGHISVSNYSSDPTSTVVQEESSFENIDGSPGSFTGNALKVVRVNAGETGLEYFTLPAGVTDHGVLTGLADDDHVQYALLAGRAAGQVLVGGTAASESLRLDSTAHATKGAVFIDGLDAGLKRAGVGILDVVSDAAGTRATARVDQLLVDSGGFGSGFHTVGDYGFGSMVLQAAGGSVTVTGGLDIVDTVLNLTSGVAIAFAGATYELLETGATLRARSGATALLDVLGTKVSVNSGAEDVDFEVYSDTGIAIKVDAGIHDTTISSNLSFNGATLFVDAASIHTHGAHTWSSAGGVFRLRNPADSVRFLDVGATTMTFNPNGNSVALSVLADLGTILTTSPTANGGAGQLDISAIGIFNVDRGLRFLNQSDGAGASTGTLTNAPSVGDPSFWLPVSVNGTDVYIPCWL